MVDLRLRGVLWWDAFHMKTSCKLLFSLRYVVAAPVSVLTLYYVVWLLPIIF